MPPELVSQARADYPDTFNVSQIAALATWGSIERRSVRQPGHRAALSMAIDREAIAERVWSTRSRRPPGWCPIGAGSFDRDVFGLHHDPEGAKAMFDAARRDPGHSMIVYDISDDGQASLDPIVDSWRRAVRHRHEVQSFVRTILEETAPAGGHRAVRTRMGLGLPVGLQHPVPLFESTSGANNLGYASDEFDEQIRLAREAVDEEAGLPYLTEAQRIVEADMPIAPITFVDDIGCTPIVSAASWSMKGRPGGWSWFGRPEVGCSP